MPSTSLLTKIRASQPRLDAEGLRSSVMHPDPVTEVSLQPSAAIKRTSLAVGSSDRHRTDADDGDDESHPVGPSLVSAGRSHIALSLAAPALLLMVAVAQMALAATTELTPWKGGGFGMFATIDEPGQRVLEVELSLQGERSTIVLTDLKDVEPATPALKAARSLPTDAMLTRAVTVLDNVKWRVGDEGVQGADPDDGQRGTVTHLSVVRPVLDGNRVTRETVAFWERR